MQKTTYKLEENRFVIENYNEAPPFADFFPGIAGRFGVPVWAYFVSRGQGVISLGVGSKDHSIMEFRSMNQALASVERDGFRTFLKINGRFHEAFRPTQSAGVIQQMTVSTGELELQELEEDSGLATSVLYYPLVESPVPALIRRVRFKNRGKDRLRLEVLDGLPRLIPYGADRHSLQEMARQVEGGMEVPEVGGLPLFRLSQADLCHDNTARGIRHLSGGNFLFSIGNGSLLKKAIVVDPALIFGDLYRFNEPAGFLGRNVMDLAAAEQIRSNRMPSAMAAIEFELGPGESYDLTTCVGFVREDLQLERFARQAARGDFLVQKRQAHLELLGRIQDSALCVSSHREFDEYVGQTFLDNSLRAGTPVAFETATGKSAFYMYSRREADLERDDGQLNVEPTYFSQGNLSYRSAIESRRMDCWFFPDLYDSGIHHFMSQVQTDGFNPTELALVSYHLRDEKELEKALKERVSDANQRSSMRQFLAAGFTPGTFTMYLEDSGVSRKEWERLLGIAMAHAVEAEAGRSGGGFYIDHWHYNLDLIETFLLIYPDHITQLLIGRTDYTFFDNPEVVLPRDEKIVIDGDRVRQSEATFRDPQKVRLIGARREQPYRVRVSYGKGRVLSTNLLVKLLCVAANKIASLDPQGLGIEMEAGRPAENESLNGLPALLGSSMGEAYELERLCRFLRRVTGEIEFDGTRPYEDLQQLIKKLLPLLQRRARSGPKGAAAFWEAGHVLREKYLLQTRLGVGLEKPLSKKDILSFLDGCVTVLSDGRGRGLKGRAFDKSGVPLSYFENQVSQFQPIGPKTNPKTNRLGLPLVKPKKWAHRPVARFLEGPAHFLRINPDLAGSVYEALRESPLFDEHQDRFKICEPLGEESFEIGRVRAWPPGWMENEAVQTPAAGRLLLEMLRSGLAAEFYRDIKTHLPPFSNPDEYGRSIYQNASFLVSSAYTDPELRGRGFQARLGGVSAEVLNMWTLMTAGPRPFFMSPEGELRFSLKPLLAGWIFTTHSVPFTYRDRVRMHEIEIPRNSFAFRFAGNTLVVYRNDARKNTYDGGSKVESYLIQYRDGTVKEVKSDSLDDKQARDLRAGKIFRIDAVL